MSTPHTPVGAMTTTVNTAHGLRALRPGAILRDRDGDLLIKDANGDFASITAGVDPDASPHLLYRMDAAEVAGEYQGEPSGFLPAEVVVS